MAKVPPLRAFRKQSTFGAIPKNQESIILDQSQNESNLWPGNNETQTVDKQGTNASFLDNRIEFLDTTGLAMDLGVRPALAERRLSTREVREKSEKTARESARKV